MLTERWRLVNGQLFDIVADPGQKKDLSKQHSSVVDDLSRRHREWFAEVTQHKGAYSRFIVGDPRQISVSFNVRDWHPTRGTVIWQQEQLADDRLFINGFWALQIVRSGKYKIRLSRFPDDKLQPIKAKLAFVELGEQRLEKSCEVSDTAVTFEVELEKGELKFQSWLVDAATGSARGAYFVTIECISKDRK